MRVQGCGREAEGITLGMGRRSGGKSAGLERNRKKMGVRRKTEFGGLVPPPPPSLLSFPRLFLCSMLLLPLLPASSAPPPPPPRAVMGGS